MSIAVVYLAWLPYGISYFKDFLDSYINHPAGHSHKLVIVFNGVQDSNKHLIDEYKSLLIIKEIQNVEFLVFEKGQDILMYKTAATMIEADYFLFLNTYSCFENKDWLKYYVNSINAEIGLVGTTASYASYLSAIKVQTTSILKGRYSLSFKFSKLKYLIKFLFLYSRNFKKFPAPHIRTTGFFISKKLFTSLNAVPIRNKMEAYYFENGKQSMTNQILAMGFKCIIVDKYGKLYQMREWPESKVFWSAEQENLLISDNQTRQYKNAGTQERNLLKKIAWNNVS